MDYIIAVYTVRESSLALNMRLRRMGIPCEVIGTPRAANAGCGLSVRFRARDLPAVRRIASTERGLRGYFMESESGLTRIY